MSKIDLQDAYKYIFVNPDDWELLGSTLNVRLSDGTIQKQYFIDCFLPFGLRTSPRIFCTYAEALRYIMLQNGVSIVANYIDDFFTCGYPDTIECSTNLQTMINTCEELGFSVQPNKTVLPTTTMEYLGIEIDTVQMQLRISDERLNDIMNELYAWKHRKVCTKRDLLSIIGKLTFVSRVVRAGVIGSDVPWLECPACNALAWVITLTE